MKKDFFTSAEIIPPPSKDGVPDWAERRIEKLSGYFDSFNIVTKPKRIDSIDFFPYVNQFRPATVHYAVGEKEPEEVMDDFHKAQELGVEHMLIIGGDLPEDQRKRKIFASDAIKIAKDNAHKFSIGAALNQYPDDPKFELKRLADKIEAGTDYIFLQPTFDIESTQDFLNWAKILLYEQNLNMPPVVDGLIVFDYEFGDGGLERVKSFGIKVIPETEKEVLEKGNNLTSCTSLYESIGSNGKYDVEKLGVYFIPFSWKQYRTLDKISGELSKIKATLFQRGDLYTSPVCLSPSRGRSES
ncbi:MAG: methylenetetrahydrofolate reductase [Candidatus Aenigmarchaeota archaeon]|nr:methylenetetrahydrofolate reductase [Candidatus Aenigmarchaeota archaeon]